MAGTKRRRSEMENTIEEEEGFSAWGMVDRLWRKRPSIKVHAVKIEPAGESPALEMLLLFPLELRVPEFDIYPDTWGSRRVTIEFKEEIEWNADLLDAANELTALLFKLEGLGDTMESGGIFGAPIIPLLYTAEQLRVWTTRCTGTTPCTEIAGYSSTSLAAVPKEYGYVRLVNGEPTTKRLVPQKFMTAHVSSTPMHQRTRRLVCGHAPLPVPYLVRSRFWRPAEEFIQAAGVALDRMPMRFLEFTRYMPSILGRIEVFLHAQELCTDLAQQGVELSRLDLLMTAISLPGVGLGSDYNALEFIGDGVLRLLVRSSVMTDSLDQGTVYDSNQSQWLESNEHLRARAVWSGITRFIVSEIDETSCKPRQASFSEPSAAFNDSDSSSSSSKSIHYQRSKTFDGKVGADVVEAIIGAAYLEGGLRLAGRFCHAIVSDKIFIRIHITAEAVLDTITDTCGASTTTEVRWTTAMEAVIGRRFQHPALLEVIGREHSSNVRKVLVVLGSTLLDHLISCTILERVGTALSPGAMTMLRSTVNDLDFIAFCGFKATARYAVTGYDPAAPEELFWENILDLFTFVIHLHDSAYSAWSRYADIRDGVLDAIWNQDIQRPCSFPIRLLSRLAPIKELSETVLAVLGAVWVDATLSSDNDTAAITACKSLARRIGLLDYVDNVLAVASDDASWVQAAAEGPREALRRMCGNQLPCRYSCTPSGNASGSDEALWKGEITVLGCVTLATVDGAQTQREAKIAAAEAALNTLTRSGGRRAIERRVREAQVTIPLR